MKLQGEGVAEVGVGIEAGVGPLGHTLFFFLSRLRLNAIVFLRVALQLSYLNLQFSFHFLFFNVLIKAHVYSRPNDL